MSQNGPQLPPNLIFPPGTDLAPNGIPWEYTAFGYNPSVPASIVAAVIFFVIGLLHAWRTARFRTLYMVPMTVGCFMETVGYIARIFSRNKPNSIPLYATQFGLIVIAPILFAASIYMVLSRIIQHVSPRHSPVRPGLIATVFVGFDIVSFLVQCAGAGVLMGSNDMNIKEIGFKLLIAGLALQVIFFAGFVVLSFIFERRATAAGYNKGGWKKLLYALYFASICVLIRSVFRVVEFSGGFKSEIAKDEKLLYTLDFMMMVLAVSIWLVVHPGPALAGPDADERDGSGAYEMSA
ncbi:hypothetical protein HK097_009441 [Rhizophlyctis rosea]|uniref:RTA1-like protein n=1 Tax=Rhizophlyctis rosea TaxID=64517 RepID=A0AAD5SAJ9_9FUNG|nr:hypothetical protein HK097_009441 [Rhizophlyctis rosea]